MWYGHVHAVKALLESGADPNLVENDGGGPLHEAAYFGSYGYERDQMDRKQPSPSVSRKEAGDYEALQYPSFLDLANSNYP